MCSSDLKEELECRGIRQKDFAKRFGLSYSALNETLHAKPVSYTHLIASEKPDLFSDTSRKDSSSDRSSVISV